MFLAVAFGAFGAHALRDRMSADMLAVYHTGVEYHVAHALGLLVVAGLIDRLPGAALARWSARSLLAGIVLFSGSLYALSLSGIRMLGVITPFGGMAFLAGWALLAAAAVRTDCQGD